MLFLCWWSSILQVKVLQIYCIPKSKHLNFVCVSVCIFIFTPKNKVLGVGWKADFLAISFHFHLRGQYRFVQYWRLYCYVCQHTLLGQTGTGKTENYIYLLLNFTPDYHLWSTIFLNFPPDLGNFRFSEPIKLTSMNKSKQANWHILIDSFKNHKITVWSTSCVVFVALVLHP